MLNAANEVAVALFLKQQIGFPEIARVIGAVLEAHQPGPVDTLEHVLGADRWAREAAANAAKVKT